MTPSSETEIFLGGGSNGKNVAPGIVFISSQLEPHRSMFSTQKKCLIGIPIRGYQNFTPCPQKIEFGAQKRPNLAQNWHFGPNIGIFAPFDLSPDQKTMQTSCLDGFLLSWYQNFCLLP